MLSVEQCRKYLPSGKYTNEQIEQIRDTMYQLAAILTDGYLNGTNKPGKTPLPHGGQDGA